MLSFVKKTPIIDSIVFRLCKERRTKKNFYSCILNLCTVCTLQLPHTNCTATPFLIDLISSTYILVIFCNIFLTIVKLSYGLQGLGVTVTRGSVSSLHSLETRLIFFKQCLLERGYKVVTSVDRTEDLEKTHGSSILRIYSHAKKNVLSCAARKRRCHVTIKVSALFCSEPLGMVSCHALIRKNLVVCLQRVLFF